MPSKKKYPGSEPTKGIDLVNHYPKVPGIDYENFILGHDRMPEEQRKKALSQMKKYYKTQQDNFMGYQANEKFEQFSKDFSQYMDVHINNIGDPFVQGNFTINSKFAERAVLDYFASLWNARWPHEYDASTSTSKDWQESYWGYILSMGSSEANIYGLWNARDYLKGRAIIIDQPEINKAKEASKSGKAYSAKATSRKLHTKKVHGTEIGETTFEPIAFFSQDTHYSIVKFMRILEIETFFEKGLKSYKDECPLKYPEDYPKNFSEQYLDASGWPLEVPSDDNGAVYIPALEKLVEFYASKGHPILICFNYGSTFKGAYDDVHGAMKKLTPILKKHGLYERTLTYENDITETRTGYWIHVDGALGAAYMNFYRQSPLSKKEVDGERIAIPEFDFSVPEVHSISMSGHKWIGIPWPCGIFMSKVKYQLCPVDDPNYIGSPDTTFSGSRNGLSPILIWDFLARNSVEDLIERIKHAEKLCMYMMERFEEIQKAHPDIDIWPEHSPTALTIRFRKASDEMTFKYSLSGEDLYVDGELREYSHIYFMENITEELIDQFVEDMKKPGAFREQTCETDKKFRHHQWH